MGSRIAALPPDPSGFEYCSLVDVVDKHPMLEQVRGYLAKYDKGSDEYYKAFFGYFPLQDYLSNRDSYMKNQVTEVQPEDPKNGYSAVYRNSLFPEKIVVGMDDGLLTGYERFNLAVRLFPNNHCLGCREYNTNTGKWSANYVWDTYKEVQERCLNLGSGILTIENMKRGKPITDNDFIVALMSPNRKEWVLTDLACQSYSITNTMLYDTLGSETSEYIMNLTEAPVIVLDKPHLFIVLALIPNLSWLNTIIIIEPMDSAELTYINTALLPKTVNGRGERITVFCMEQVEQIGKMNRLAPIPPKPESVYCVNFTSGSTGVPKGVELTHLTYSCAVTLTVNGAPMPRDIQVYGLCVLPLAHVYQRQLMGKALLIGVGLGFLHGPDPSLLLEDMRALNPHQLALVPRIVNKLQMLIEHSLKPDELELIQEALKISLTDSDVSGPRSLDPAKYMDIRSAKKFKALVSKIRRLVGWENMVFLVSGGAPISPGTLSFIRIAVDLRIRQGYGLTETFGAIFVNEASQIDYKTCGCLSNTAELRLKSIPEMGYDAVKNRMGEVQVRGPHVFRRYLKADEQTKDAFEEGGWLKTGDIGSLDPLGRIQIIDRVKNIFKLAQGEYIVPEKIENIYLSSCPFISQIFIHGSSLSHYLVAIVGIDPLLLGGVLEKMGVNAKKVAVKDIMYLINTDLKLKKALLMLINSYAKSLQGFEKVANMYVDVEPLKISEGTITPTFKFMRPQCRKRFGPILEHLYNEGSLLKMENL